MIKMYYDNGETHEVDPSKHTVDLKWLQEKVGGFIQMVTLNDGSQIICDEEGKLKRKLVNKKATTELWDPSFGIGTDVLVGTVIHLTGKDKLK